MSMHLLKPVLMISGYVGQIILTVLYLNSPCMYLFIQTFVFEKLHTHFYFNWNPAELVCKTMRCAFQSFVSNTLTLLIHWSFLAHICGASGSRHSFKLLLVACPTPSYDLIQNCLNQRCLIWTLETKFVKFRDFNGYWNMSFFKFNLVIDCWGVSRKFTLRLLPMCVTDDRKTLVQTMAWCRQTTSHYMNQRWQWFRPPCGVTRPQWVNVIQNCILLWSLHKPL